MKIFETLDRDPRNNTLVNEGQARISDVLDEAALRELRSELETFVCDGQYGKALVLILQNFLTQYQTEKRQHAAWVSGFFGSGKSHLLKMIGHIWSNTEFSDGATARSLVARLPDDASDLLRELDTQAARSGKKTFAVTGTSISGSSHVRLTILAIILRACGLPERINLARFCIWLQDEGYYERFMKALEKNGRELSKELNNLYVSGHIAKALLACDPNFAQDEKQVREVLRAQYPLPTSDITTNEFITIAKRVLAPDENIPLTMLILDEVQQFIGRDEDRMTAFTETVEATQTKMNSRVMIVASGQAALSDTPLLQRMAGRFRIQVQLSDNDVEAVTRKVLLHKKPGTIDSLNDMLNRNSGEISKHLQGTRLGQRQEDRQIIAIDYPLLPTRRRFWEECFRSVDAAGTQSQLRSQLQIMNEALKEVAEEDVGKVITADRLYSAISPNLVNTGVLLPEIRDKIDKLDDSTHEGMLKKRICSLVFLINKLPREAGIDTGVRATANMLADLIVDDLETDTGPFRKKIGLLLEEMACDNTLMKVGDEYRIQTAESTEWERFFQEKKAATFQNEALIASKRSEYIATSVQQAGNKTRIRHGEAKESRKLGIYEGLETPTNNLADIIIWMRDGWNTGRNEVINEARRSGLQDPIIHIFIPKKGADELRSSIADEEAAKLTLSLKGVPHTPEGQEARSSMESKLNNAVENRKNLIIGIIEQAVVFQGGGNEVFGDTLSDKIAIAVEDSLSRRFDRFGDGDHKDWPVALRRSREGNDQPLSVVDWHKSVEDHPVSREVINIIGNGSKGSDVFKELTAAPYGWPQDAIAAILVALTRSGTLRATINGVVAQASALDQSKIKIAEFRPEKVRLGAQQKLELRGLFQNLGVSVKSGDEEYRANDFLNVLKDLSQKAGGSAPLPEPPDSKLIDELKTLTGTEQLGKILDNKDDIAVLIEKWKELHQQAEKRLPTWNLLRSLLIHAEKLPVADEVTRDVEAIIKNRSLISDIDQVSPIRAKVAAALRSCLTTLATDTSKAWEDGQKALSSDDAWSRLEDGVRADILSQVGLQQPVSLIIDTDENLLSELTTRDIDSRHDMLLAIPGRFSRAMDEATIRLKPKARSVSVRRATLETEAEVKAWLETQKKDLLEAIKEGPVIIG